MNLEIEPYVGVGPIRLGMTRDEVRRVLPVPAERFQKFRDAPPIDRVRNPSLMVHYDVNDICEAIELALPGSPTLFGRELLGQSFEVLRDWFAQQDSDVAIDGDGLISKKVWSGPLLSRVTGRTASVGRRCDHFSPRVLRGSPRTISRVAYLGT